MNILVKETQWLTIIYISMKPNYLLKAKPKNQNNNKSNFKYKLLISNSPTSMTYYKWCYKSKSKAGLLARHQWLTPRNPHYLGGWSRGNCSSGPAHTNSSQDPISKITSTKRTRVVVQGVGNLLCKHEALSSNLNPTQKKHRPPTLATSISSTLAALQSNHSLISLQWDLDIKSHFKNLLELCNHSLGVLYLCNW
jgi:hypothetical protein